MNTSDASPIRVQPGPANYYSHSGAIAQLENIYSPSALENALWISGKQAEAAALPYLPKLYSSERCTKLRFVGHCTHEFVDEAASAHGDGASLVIGIGGGSALDSAKALAAKLDLPFIAIPTIAATCAAVTPLSVWYDLKGKALGYEIFKRAAELVLVEPHIIIEAPSQYLQAGYADTLAKWYEAEILCQGNDHIPLAAQLGLDTSKKLNDILMSKGEQAFADMALNNLTPAFLDIVDTILIGGGLVGGLGERYTRIAAAHAVHNGLSSLEESESQLHGIKVAYGILVQNALLKNREELQLLIAKFKALKLPTKLADLGIDFSQKDKIDRFVQATLVPWESIHLLAFPVDETALHEAVALVEELG